MTTDMINMETNEENIELKNKFDVALTTEDINKSIEEEKVKKPTSKILWRINYMCKMMKKYGLKEDFIIPSQNDSIPDTIIRKGDLWYFKLERKFGEDNEIAENLRQNPKNINKLHAYLYEKYFINWIYESKDTEDDCAYLIDLRYRKEIEDREAYYAHLKRIEQHDTLNYDIDIENIMIAEKAWKARKDARENNKK
jgi:hypothetical protein